MPALYPATQATPSPVSGHTTGTMLAGFADTCPGSCAVVKDPLGLSQYKLFANACCFQMTIALSWVWIPRWWRTGTISCSRHVGRCNKNGTMILLCNYYDLLWPQMAATGFGTSTEPANIICEIPNQAYLYSPP